MPNCWLQEAHYMQYICLYTLEVQPPLFIGWFPHQKSWFTWKWKELGHWIMFSFHEFCMVYFSNDRFLHVPWKRTPESKKGGRFPKLLVKLVVWNGGKDASQRLKQWSWDIVGTSMVPLVSLKHGSCSTSLNVRKWAADETQSHLKQKNILSSVTWSRD